MYTVIAFRMSEPGKYVQWIEKSVETPIQAFKTMDDYRSIAVLNKYSGAVFTRAGGEVICRRDYGYCPTGWLPW